MEEFLLILYNKYALTSKKPCVQYGVILKLLQLKEYQEL